MHIFLTGNRNVGKTTIINNVVSEVLSRAKSRDEILIGGFNTCLGEEFSLGKSYVYMHSAKIPVLGVIKPQSNDFLDKVRNHKKVKVINVTPETRDSVPSILLSSLSY